MNEDTRDNKQVMIISEHQSLLVMWLRSEFSWHDER